MCAASVRPPRDWALAGHLRDPVRGLYHDGQGKEGWGGRNGEGCCRTIFTSENGDIRNAFLFLDLHTTAFRQFFEGDTFHEEMDARDVITGAIAELGLPDFDCASTDLGRPARIEEIADMFGGGVALISKMRNKLGKSRVRRVIAEHSLAGRTLLISDDMIRSADSLLNAVEAYQKNEAVGFFAEATHLALDSEEIIDRLLASPIQTIVTTNSHPMSQHPRVQGSSRFVVKDVSHCFIEAIIRFAA